MTRFHPSNPQIAYTVQNATLSTARSRGSRMTPKQGFVCRWDVEKWQLVKVRKIGERGITCFDVRCVAQNPHTEYICRFSYLTTWMAVQMASTWHMVLRTIALVYLMQLPLRCVFLSMQWILFWCKRGDVASSFRFEGAWVSSNCNSF